jgi:hypothetical protein
MSSPAHLDRAIALVGESLAALNAAFAPIAAALASEPPQPERLYVCDTCLGEFPGRYMIVGESNTCHGCQS